MVHVNIFAALLFFLVVCIIALFFAYMGSRIIKGLGPKSMYNVALCLVIASVLSGCMSLWAVWIALPNSHSVDYTHQDVVVDILGVLVTILMGWNIISVVDIKKKADQVNSISRDFEHVIAGIMRLNMRGFIMRGDKDALIDNCFSSLEEIMNCDNRDINKFAIKEIMILLHQIHISYNDGDTVFIFPGRKQNYRFILRNIENEYKEEVSRMIENAQESPTIGQEFATANHNNVNAE